MKYAIDMVASLRGWKAKNNRKKIQCNQVGQFKAKRKYQGGSLHSNCSWVISLKPIVELLYITSKSENSHTNLIGTSQWKLFPKFVSMVGYALPAGQIGLRLQRVQEHVSITFQSMLFFHCVTTLKIAPD